MMKDVPLRYVTQVVCDEITNSGVDWITCTQEQGSEGERLLDAAHAALEEEVQRGNDVKGRVWQGYNTLSAGGVMLGERDDTVLCQLRSHAADAYWQNVLPHAKNVSRLDFQCTGRYYHPRPSLARDSFDELPERPYDRGRPRRAGIVAYQSYGDTLMLGSRSSNAYGRHYDKGMESKSAQPGKEWRWEVELKRDTARSTAICMAGTEDPSTYIQSQVYAWFWRWGLKPGFPRPGVR
jgi:hypothetical protein